MEDIYEFFLPSDGTEKPVTVRSCGLRLGDSADPAMYDWIVVVTGTHVYTRTSIELDIMRRQITATYGPNAAQTLDGDANRILIVPNDELIMKLAAELCKTLEDDESLDKPQFLKMVRPQVDSHWQDLSLLQRLQWVIDHETEANPEHALKRICPDSLVEPIAEALDSH